MLPKDAEKDSTAPPEGAPFTEGMDPDVMKGMMGELGRMQKAIVDIQTGKRQPPPWFKKTGFDTAVVSIEGLGDFEMISATSGTMDRLERPNLKPDVEAALEMDAVVEAIEKMPTNLVLKRAFKAKVDNREHKFDAGYHFDNLWKEQEITRELAREVLKVLVGGKMYAMLRMAMQWLSKVDVPTMIGVDPEPGNGAEGGGTPRPQA
jgi:hypothetical protein